MTNDKPPEKTAGDAGAAVVRAALSAVPLVGGPAVELFNAIVTPPLERRRDAWIQEIAEGLRDLEANKGVRVEDLKENPVFLDTLLQATHAALRSHQSEKREALRAAVLNSALPNPPDEALQQMFVAWIGDLTAWHLRLLRFFDNPAAWFQTRGLAVPSSGSTLTHMLLAAYPELQGRQAFYDLVWAELWRRGLTNTDGLHTMMTSSGLTARRTSDLGQDFLAFITSEA